MRQAVASLLHEGIVTLFRENPRLAVELLRALGIEVPKHSHVELASETLRNLQPVALAADAVLVLSRRGRPVLAVILESQLRDDEDKAFTWPVYLAIVRREHRCPVMILVVTTDEAVARSASQPIEMGVGSIVRPVVVGPSRIPRVVDEAVAEEHVELAVLSALAHGRDDVELRIVAPALAALGRARLDDERRGAYTHMVVGVLGRAARAALEARMKSGRFEYVSDFARDYLAKGKAEGKIEGKAEGKIEGEADALFTVLDARGLSPSQDVAARVRACRDPEQIARWIRRAAIASTLDQVFEDG